MTKPDWIGEETPEMAAIRDGRDWDDLEREDWERISALAMERQDATVTRDGRVIRGTHRAVFRLNRSRLWNRRREVVADPANGILDWPGLADEPERPQLVPDRGGKSFHVVTDEELLQEIAGEPFRVVPAPRRPGNRPGPKAPRALDLNLADDRAHLSNAWAKAGTGQYERTWQRIASQAGTAEKTIRNAFSRAEYDLAHYRATGEVRKL